MSAHQAELLTEWGTITFLPNDAVALEDEAHGALTRRGVTIDDAAIERIEGEADVRLADGRVLAFAGLFVATSVSPASPLPEQVGCEIEETPWGR